MRPKQSAIEYLTRLMMDPACVDRGRLPPLARCARLAGVSKVTMSRAVAELSRAGRIVPVPGRGLLIGEAANRKGKALREPSPLFPPARTDPGARVRAQLLEDIAAGVFPPGKALPGRKVLCHRYRTGPVTLRRALLEVARDVNLTPLKRGLAVPSMRQREQSTVVLLHHLYGKLKRGPFPSFRLEALVRHLERRGQEANFVCRTVPYLRLPEGGSDATSFAEVSGDLQRIEHNSPVLGYLLWTMTEYGHNADLISWLRRSHKPVAVIDDVGDFAHTFPAALWSRSRLFSVGGSGIAPLRVAQHLLRLGHRRAAFVTLYQNLPWSRRRFSVLREAFRRSGGECRSFSPDHPTALSINPLDQYFEFGKVLYILDVSRNLIPARHAELTSIFEEAMRRTREESLTDVVHDTFERVLREEGTTAWICANDQLALLAMDFLSRRGIRVPEEVSVVGFDDILEALAGDLTTYNFTIEAVGNKALDSLLHGNQRAGAGAGPAIEETEGIIIERRSVGPALGR